MQNEYKLIIFSLFILQLANVLILFSFIYWDLISKLQYQNTCQPVDIHFETTNQPIAIKFNRTGHLIAIYLCNVKENELCISGNFYITSCKFNITFPLCTFESCSTYYYFFEELNQ